MSDIIELPESRLSKAVGISGQLATELAKSSGVDVGVACPSSTSGANGGVPAGANPARQETSGGHPPDTGAMVETQHPPIALPVALAPLHEMEESLMAMLDTEAMVTEEQEQAFLQDLSTTMQATVAKRDRVGAFIKHCEARAAECTAEIERLSARKKMFAGAAERVRNYVLWIIQALGPDDGGKPRKLEGEKFTFSTRKLKDQLEIYDETRVPNAFKTVNIELPAEVYFRYARVLKELLGIETASDFSIDETALRKALEGAPALCMMCGGSGRHCEHLYHDDAGELDCPCPDCYATGVISPSVPGAKLVSGRTGLVLR
jgi:Siphovirus Gp157